MEDESLHYKGYMNLAKDLPDEMIGSPMWRRGYLLVDHVNVHSKRQGYGYLLYKTALKLSLEKGYRGICSYKKGRSNDADNIWEKLVTFSDGNYDYVDIKDLGTRLKETLNS